jgi:DNA ligase-4
MRGIKKTNYAKQFVSLVFKSNRKVDFTYPILRLLMPNDDRDRGNYGLKEKNMSKVIADSLNITK